MTVTGKGGNTESNLFYRKMQLYESWRSYDFALIEVEKTLGISLDSVWFAVFLSINGECHHHWRLNVTTPRLRYGSHWHGTTGALIKDGSLEFILFTFFFLVLPSPYLTPAFFSANSPVLSFTPFPRSDHTLGSLACTFTLYGCLRIAPDLSSCWFFLDNFGPKEDCRRSHLDDIPALDLCHLMLLKCSQRYFDVDLCTLTLQLLRRLSVVGSC